MTEFQKKILGIIEGTYKLSRKEKALERFLWERNYYEEDNTPANIGEFITDKSVYKVNPQETEQEKKERLKKYNREYHREYYRRMLAKNYNPNHARTDEKAKARTKKYNSKICDYNGEEVRFNTLIQRLYRVYGNYHDATEEAKKYLRK